MTSTKTKEVNNTLTMEEIRERLQDARELRNSLTGHLAHEVLPRVRGTAALIRKDRNLTSKGQTEKIERYKKQQEVRLLREIVTLKNSHDLLLKDAKSSAEAILIASVEAPEEKEQALFDIEKNKRQSTVLFAPTTEAKITALSNYAALGNRGQWEAREIQGDYLAMSQQAIASTMNPMEVSKIAKSLGRINKHLESKVMTEDQHAASELLESINAKLNADLVNTAALGNALSEISPTTLQYANKLDQYEIDHADNMEEYDRASRLGMLIK